MESMIFLNRFFSGMMMIYMMLDLRRKPVGESPVKILHDVF